MTTIRQSIEVQAPVHTLFDTLSHFEGYPRFLDNVEQVQQLDDSLLHWTTKMANRPVEWDASITRLEADRCIAWRDLSGVSSDCRIDVEALGAQASKAIFTLEAEPGQFPGLVAGDRLQDMEQQLRQAMERLKSLVEDGDFQCQLRTRGSGASISGSPTEILEDEPDEAAPRGFKPDQDQKYQRRT